LVGEVVVTEVCHEGESTHHLRRQRKRTRQAVGILLITLAAAACGLVDLPLIAAYVLCGMCISASLVGFWLLAAYQRSPSFSAIPGASVPSEVRPCHVVHGATFASHSQACHD